MNIQKMHIAVQQGVDKINSLQADSLLTQEIDLELNKSIMRFVNLKYGRNNMYRQGFEQSQKRIDDLRSLVSSSEDFVFFKERRVLSNNFGNKFDLLYVDKFVLPNNYLYHINSYCNVLQNPSCDRSVKFKLERISEFKMVFSFKLSQLRIAHTRPNAPEIVYLHGWIPKIDIIGGMTPSNSDGEIDFSNVATVDEVGGRQVFTKNLWNAVEYGYTDAAYPNLPMSSLNWGSSGNQQAFQVIPLTSVPEATIDNLNISSITGGFLTTFDAKVLKMYNAFIPDTANWDREQAIIDSILEAGNSNPGVDIFYEEYDGQTQEEKFTVELDLNIWNFLTTPEQAGQFAETLNSLGKSVNLETGAILNDTTGSQNAQDFTSFLNIAVDTRYDGNVFQKTYGSAGNLISTVQNDDQATADGLTETHAGLSNFWELFENQPAVQAAMNEANIENFNSGIVNRHNFPSFNMFELNTSGLKRYIVNETWTISDTLYESVDSIGKDFPGISRPIKYIQHDDILGLMYDPFNKPTDSRILGVFDSNTILVYTLIKNVTQDTADLVSILPYSVKLKYLKKPAQVDYNANINCDLPQHTHEEIVAMTVSSILEGINDPRYKSHMSELMKNE